MARLQTEYKYLAIPADPNIEGDEDGYIIYREPTNEEWNEWQAASSKGFYMSQRQGQESSGALQMKAANQKLGDTLFVRCENIYKGDALATRTDIPDRMVLKGVAEEVIEPKDKSKSKKIESGN